MTDIKLLISEYIKDKQRDIENDSFNIVNGEIVHWNFKHIPKPSLSDLQKFKSSVDNKVARVDRAVPLKKLGNIARKKCDAALDLIAGHNQQNLSDEQIQQMIESFGPVVQALSVLKMPSLAISLINNIVPDGVIITQELKDDVIAELRGL